MERVEQQPGYVLHARPYRETSLLLECLTREHGRVGLVARGVREQLEDLLSGGGDDLLDRHGTVVRAHGCDASKGPRSVVPRVSQ